MNIKRLIVLLLAFLAITLLGCSAAALHGGQDDHSNQVTTAEFESKKTEFSESMVVGFSVEEVFPLLGPVRESDWIPGWEADLIWSESGFAEEGAIFQTALHGDVKETWVISQYEPMEKIVFVHYNPTVVTRLSIEFTDGGDHTQLIWSESKTAMDKIGYDYLGTLTQEHYSTNINNFATMLSYFLETGEMIDADAVHETTPSHD